MDLRGSSKLRFPKVRYGGNKRSHKIPTNLELGDLFDTPRRHQSCLHHYELSRLDVYSQIEALWVGVLATWSVPCVAPTLAPVAWTASWHYKQGCLSRTVGRRRVGIRDRHRTAGRRRAVISHSQGPHRRPRSVCPWLGVGPSLIPIIPLIVSGHVNVVVDGRVLLPPFLHASRKPTHLPNQLPQHILMRTHKGTPTSKSLYAKNQIRWFRSKPRAR